MEHSAQHHRVKMLRHLDDKLIPYISVRPVRSLDLTVEFDQLLFPNRKGVFGIGEVLVEKMCF